MSEKIYARLLRLYPSSFRKKYEGEALQLIRDRLRDERGLFKRVRLWWDLVADVLAGLPCAYRNSYAVTEAASLSLHAAGVPSFKTLDKEPLGLGSILAAVTISLVALAAFSFLLGRPIAYESLPGSNKRMSPIESVLQRVNRGPAPDTSAGVLKTQPSRCQRRQAERRHNHQRPARPLRTRQRRPRSPQFRTAKGIKLFPLK